MHKAFTQSHQVLISTGGDKNHVRNVTFDANARQFNSNENFKKDSIAPMTEKRHQTINSEEKTKGFTEHSTSNTFTLLDKA